jgi:hypothetical protein
MNLNFLSKIKNKIKDDQPFGKFPSSTPLGLKYLGLKTTNISTITHMYTIDNSTTTLTSLFPKP